MNECIVAAAMIGLGYGIDSSENAQLAGIKAALVSGGVYIALMLLTG